MTATQALQGRRMNTRQQLRFPSITQNQDAVFQSIHCLPHLFAIGLSQVEHYGGHWQAHKLGWEQCAQPTAWSTLGQCLPRTHNGLLPSPSTNQPPSEEMRAEQMRRSSSVKCCTICGRAVGDQQLLFRDGATMQAGQHTQAAMCKNGIVCEFVAQLAVASDHRHSAQQICCKHAEPARCNSSCCSQSAHR